MGKLISVVGNSGVGKTTLTKELCKQAPFTTALEQHEERPFQKQFGLDLQRYSLPNQIDYLLYRAEQEQSIRQGDMTGIQDGGLEEDFYVFTRLFYEKGYLKEQEYRLCERMYQMLRSLLPPPDLIIRLTAPLNVIAERYARRGRKLEIATAEDLGRIETLLEQWLGSVDSTPIITVDASADGFAPKRVKELLALWDFAESESPTC
ncbi:MAG TPA: deoxynucleoside kinase [Thermoflexia bacterium]|nr:deoxynucleoside kinase [Thermoflexia bacterium]